jgi:hypothetical protein
MIKSKIDARERALEMATQLAIALFKGGKTCDLMPVAKELYEYLIGDAELPEVTDDNAHIKELLEIANKSFDNSRKCNNYSLDDLEKFLDKRGMEHLAKLKTE